MPSFFFRELIIVLLIISDSYKLKYKVRLLKTVSGIFDFQFRLAFIKAYIFVQQNEWTI